MRFHLSTSQPSSARNKRREILCRASLGVFSFMSPVLGHRKCQLRMSHLSATSCAGPLLCLALSKETRQQQSLTACDTFSTRSLGMDEPIPGRTRGMAADFMRSTNCFGVSGGECQGKSPLQKQRGCVSWQRPCPMLGGWKHARETELCGVINEVKLFRSRFSL